jgi:flagellar biosynthesis protein
MSVPHETSHGLGNGPPLEGENTADPKRHLAVALRYERERKTPVVVAKGSGLVADAILKQARDAGVFVHSSRELIDLLMKVDLDARIPPSLYVAVAEVLAWVYRQDERAGARVAGDLPVGKPVGAPAGANSAHTTSHGADSTASTASVGRPPR